jgi:hypothetical protein
MLNAESARKVLACRKRLLKKKDRRGEGEVMRTAVDVLSPSS